MHAESFKVSSDKVVYGPESITSTYQYQSTEIQMEGGQVVVKPIETTYQFKTDTRVPKLGEFGGGGGWRRRFRRPHRGGHGADLRRERPRGVVERAAGLPEPARLVSS